MINSNISYTGTVYVDILGKPRKVSKNNGTKPFFKLLYDVLAQKLSDEDTRSVSGHTFTERLPTFMNIFYVDNTAQSKQAACTAFMNGTAAGNAVLLHDTPIQKRLIKSGTNDAAVFEALLYNSNVYNTLPSGSYQAYLVVRDGTSNRTILAFTEISLSDFAPVYENVDSQARLTWVMKFNNTSTPETSTPTI